MPQTPRTMGNPLTWAVDAAVGTSSALGEAATALGSQENLTPEVRRIGLDDLRAALRAGLADFSALRSDVIFPVVLYPIIGICMGVIALDNTLMPRFYPLSAGFALLGPVAAIGRYALSRQREAGAEVGWGDALSAFRAGVLAPVLTLGADLRGIVLMWIVVAPALFQVTVGAEAPASAAAFLSDVLSTSAGWTMILVGTAAGFVFAAVVLGIGLVSFPMLIDRRMGLPVAVMTSVRVARANPVTVAVWGLIVAVGLALGSLPLFLGLIVVLPVPGHAPWHLYRRAVTYAPASAPSLPRRSVPADA